MKKLLFTLLISSFTIFGINAQVTCSASYGHSNASSNSLKVNFTNGSSFTSMNAVRYTLNFGDGNSNNSAFRWSNNLSHTYQSPGTYATMLTMEVIDSLTSTVLCTSYAYDTLVISSVSSCNASYQYQQTASGSLTVNFQSTGSVSSSVAFYETFKWYFGDGDSSLQQNPSHTYANSGRYTVRLIHEVRDSATSVVQCRDAYVRTVEPGSVDSCGVTFTSSTNSQSLRASFIGYGQAKNYNGVQFQQHFTWDFGDGNTGTGKFISHTYAQPGTYQVVLLFEGIDSVNQTTFCLDTAIQTVTVTTPALQCNAFFAPDSSLIGTPNFVIYNYSTPLQSNSNYNVSYFWDFGDGDTSVQPFPTHTYPGPGSYNLCLTIFVTDTQNRSCSDSYCHTLTMDSVGNIYYKNGTAQVPFTLNILDPNAVGQEEFDLSKLEVYPNPASDRINISGLKTNADWSLYNISGSKVASGELRNGVYSFSVPEVTEGLYILNIQSESGQDNGKVYIKR